MLYFTRHLKALCSKARPISSCAVRSSNSYHVGGRLEPTCPGSPIPAQRDYYRVACLITGWKSKVIRLPLIRPILFPVIKLFYPGIMNSEIEQQVSKIKLPECIRGMKKLNRDLFFSKQLIPGLCVPVKGAGLVNKQLRKSLMKIPKVKPVAELPEDDPEKDNMRLFLFDPDKFSSASDFTEEQQRVLAKAGVDVESLKHYEIDLGYDNWGTSDILKAVLPVDSDSVSGFSIVGHIAHLNLKSEVLDYKHFIGEVILDKTHTIKTVVNKLNTIDNTFRNFQMELLAGEENYITLTRENGCSFELDFSKVYWNPRLGTEHSRIVKLCPKESVVYDVFAGIGPFSIPAARKGCTVVANDLNPVSFTWLNHNIKLNKSKGHIDTHNLDGREFIQTVVKRDLIDRWTKAVEEGSMSPVYIVMNLPAMAIEFLDAFRDIGEAAPPECCQTEVIEMPQIHCYCFTKSEDARPDIEERVGAALGGPVPDGMNIRHVRNVAPNKEMYCVSFTLPHTIAFGNSQRSSIDNQASPLSGQPETKRLKLETKLHN